MQPGVEAPLTTQRVGQGVRGERAAGGEMEGGGFRAEIIVTPAAPSLHGSSGCCRPSVLSEQDQAPSRGAKPL